MLDRDGMARLIHGRRVLLTGAGGTIGAELARQIAAFSPGRLVLLDNSEFALYGIELELHERFPSLVCRSVARRYPRPAAMERVIAAEKPEIVFHAAALKHLPIVEPNPVEGVLTNVIGTRNVAEAARPFGAALVVMISTDKAVNPTSVMGATKRVAECFCQALDLYEARRRAPVAAGTRYVTVRFGNVLGSTGSVVPLFQRQLAAGGPLTVTDPEVTRFFMTVREAVELVLQASALSPAAQAAETRGKIFVLDMGEPVKIVDLAHQMIRLAGLAARPGHCDRVDRPPPGRKAARRAVPSGRAADADRAPGDPPRRAAHRRLCDARPLNRRARGECPLATRAAGTADPRAAGSRVPPPSPAPERRGRLRAVAAGAATGE